MCAVCHRHLPLGGQHRHACPGPPTRTIDRPVPPSPHRRATWAALEPRCVRCQGQWRHARGGVVCSLCGYDVFIAAELVALARRETSPLFS